MGQGLKRLWPLVLTVAIFAVIFSRIPFGRLVDALSHARLLPFLALMGTFSVIFFAILIPHLPLLKLIVWSQVANGILLDGHASSLHPLCDSCVCLAHCC